MVARDAAFDARCANFKPKLNPPGLTLRVCGFERLLGVVTAQLRTGHRDHTRRAFGIKAVRRSEDPHRLVSLYRGAIVVAAQLVRERSQDRVQVGHV